MKNFLKTFATSLLTSVLVVVFFSGFIVKELFPQPPIYGAATDPKCSQFLAETQPPNSLDNKIIDHYINDYLDTNYPGLRTSDAFQPFIQNLTDYCKSGMDTNHDVSLSYAINWAMGKQ